MLLVVCGLVLVYAKWWAWYGGICLGAAVLRVRGGSRVAVLIAVRLVHGRRARLAGNALTLVVLDAVRRGSA